MHTDTNVVVSVCLAAKLNTDCPMVHTPGGGVVGMGDGFSLSLLLNFESRPVTLVSVTSLAVSSSFLRKVSSFSASALTSEKELLTVFVLIE